MGKLHDDTFRNYDLSESSKSTILQQSMHRYTHEKCSKEPSFFFIFVWFTFQIWSSKSERYEFFSSVSSTNCQFSDYFLLPSKREIVYIPMDSSSAIVHSISGVCKLLFWRLLDSFGCNIASWLQSLQLCQLHIVPLIRLLNCHGSLFNMHSNALPLVSCLSFGADDADHPFQ